MNENSRITIVFESIVLGSLVLAVSACAAKRKTAAAPAAAESPADAGDFDGTLKSQAGPASFEELETRLRQYEVQAMASGVELPAAPATAPQDDTEPERRDERVEGERVAQAGAEGLAEDARSCERVCDLAEAICDLESKICDLADRHPTERRYAQTCARAESDCDRASAACTGCSD